MRLRKFLSVTCLIALISVLTACKHSGSEYLGKWEDKADNTRHFEIVRNGDSFLCLREDNKIPVVLDKDSNTLKAGGIEIFSYVKDSDTLLIPDGTEFKRMK